MLIVGLQLKMTSNYDHLSCPPIRDGNGVCLPELFVSEADNGPRQLEAQGRVAQAHDVPTPTTRQTMTFTAEVLLKGYDEVVDEVIHRDGPEPRDWTDDDVREVLRLTLVSFDRVQNPDVEGRTISLRGLSWIVTPVKQGVAIAIASGAVVAGPFATDVDALTAAIGRVLAMPKSDGSTVH